MAVAGMAFQRRIRLLTSVMPLADALKLALREKRPGDVKIYLSSIGREVALRGATTDMSCFEKVFIHEEYRSPFDCSPQVIVDAGANVGMTTLYFAKRYPEARILAIEPESNNFKMLQRNCAGLSNVMLVQAALWPAHRRLTISGDGAGEWAYYVTEQGATESANKVCAITIEDVLQRLSVSRIDLLKLDIEGSERELFSTDAGTWLDRVEYIVVELHDRYRPGCAKAFYSAVATRNFVQENRGENVFIQLKRPASRDPYSEPSACVNQQPSVSLYDDRCDHHRQCPQW